jgi:hypothetical protein
VTGTGAGPRAGVRAGYMASRHLRVGVVVTPYSGAASFFHPLIPLRGYRFILFLLLFLYKLYRISNVPACLRLKNVNTIITR